MDLRDVEFWDKDWIELTQDMDRWEVLVNAVIKLKVHKMQGIS
jgi:hypothetical protein